MITVDVTNDQTLLSVDDSRIRKAVKMILRDRAVEQGRIGVAVVDDAAITELHRKYLGQDEPTDVMSFPLERGEHSLEGEVIVSAETAALAAGWYEWPAEDELLLYVVHGTLHLVGFDDTTPQSKSEMRRQESMVLARMGVRRVTGDPNQPPTELEAEGESTR